MCFAASDVTAAAAVVAVDATTDGAEEEEEVTAVTAAVHNDAAVYVMGEKVEGEDDVGNGDCERRSRPLVARYATPVTMQVTNPPIRRF